MKPVFESLRPFIRGIVKHAVWVLAGAFVLSVVSFLFARQLRIDTDFANLIPKDYPSVQALEKLRDTVGGESGAAVVIESPSFEANKAFAEALIPKALAMEDPKTGEPYLTRVDYRKDTAFLQNNALYFATYAELDTLDAYLDDQIEQAKQEANPFYFDIGDDDEPAGVDSTALMLEDSYRTIVGKEYPISDDSTTMVLRFYPAGSQTDVGFIEDLYADLDHLVSEVGPANFHPDMKITLAGRLMRQMVEINAITRDVQRSFLAGIAAVLLSVVLYFFYKAYHARAGRHFSRRILMSELARTPVMAIVIGLPLIMSLTWTFGLAYLAFDTLNLMTSTLGLVLFGLGIDYGIHFYARYTEERGQGHSVLRSAETTFTSTGQAITIGAFTTATALFILMIADFRGFSEFGFIAGMGILFALLSMTIVMPALLALFERFALMNLETIQPAGSARNGRKRRFPGAHGIVIGSAVAVVLAIVFLPSVSFQYDFGKLEPEYTDYWARNALVRRVYDNGRHRNAAYVIVDTPEEVPPITQALDAYMAADTLTPTIERYETLQERFPLTSVEQRHKLDRLAEIRHKLDDPFIEQDTSTDLTRLRRAAQTREPIDIQEVPQNLRNQFTSKSGELGNFVMIYPAVGLANGKNSMAFARDVGTITTADGRTYHAGSTSLVAADMLRLMLKEAPWMVILSFIIVAALMYVNFRSVRWSLLALLPLVVGVLWMLLLMEIFGLKLNFYNLVVLPAVLGIGNDAGVHIVHRYQEEGFGSIRRVIRSTGEHVTMGSLTTMIGFAGLLLSFHPGLRSIGELAVVGIGATLLAALLFLPGLLQWLEDRSKWIRQGRERATPPEPSPEPALAE